MNPERTFDFDRLPPVPEGRPFAAEWWLALAHLRSKKQEAFLSLVTLLSILGVVAGVATLNIVLSVMTGFERDLRDKILGANAHIVVLGFSGAVADPEPLLEKLREIPDVAASAPFVYHEAMIRSPWSATGIILKGIDPRRTGDVTALRDDLVAGYVPAFDDALLTAPEEWEHGPWSSGHERPLKTDAEKRALFEAMSQPFDPPSGEPSDVAAELGALAPAGGASAGPEEALEPEPEARALPGIFLGSELVAQLQIAPGDEVQVIDPLGGGTGLMGIPTPKVRRFRVAGVFDSGMYEYDTKWTYVNNADAQDFLGIGSAVTGLEIKVSAIDEAETIADAVEAKLGYPLYARHWKELNQALFEALELEKLVMGLILFLIVGVAALLIVTTLIMTVITKGREIAILKAMGASNSTILRIFVIEGSLIGLIGTSVGTALGLAGCWFLDWYSYPLETDVYFLSKLPVVVESDNVVAIASAALLISFVATLYPAWRAAALDPVEGLRYE